MSPEIRKNGVLIANLPDQSGVYDTSIGTLTLDLEGIDAHRGAPYEMKMSADWLRGRVGSSTESGLRVVSLSASGKGRVTIRGHEVLEVALKDVPIRRGYGRMVERDCSGLGHSKHSLREWQGSTWMNPKWVKRG